MQLEWSWSLAEEKVALFGSNTSLMAPRISPPSDMLFLFAPPPPLSLPHYRHPLLLPPSRDMLIKRHASGHMVWNSIRKWYSHTCVSSAFPGIYGRTEKKKKSDLNHLLINTLHKEGFAFLFVSRATGNLYDLWPHAPPHPGPAFGYDTNEPSVPLLTILFIRPQPLDMVIGSYSGLPFSVSTLLLFILGTKLYY